MTGIFVCPWAEVEDSVEDTGATHVVSLLGVEGVPDTPTGVEPENHLYLEMDDISGSIGGYISPGMDHIQELLDFVSGWDQRSPILTHCYAGISRSTAAALIIAVHLNPGREAEAAALLRQRAPHAQPNRRMIELADQVMDCRGRLIDAHTEMGPRVDRGIYGRLFSLPLRVG